jgi:hypothetical protein
MEQPQKSCLETTLSTGRILWAGSLGSLWRFAD